MNRYCRFCGSLKLKHLISFKDYPIFIGCSDCPIEEDKLYLFEMYLCERCKIIQQIVLPPIEILYEKTRAFGIGKVWEGHYDSFYRFLRRYFSGVRDILEIGGGNGILLSKLLQEGNLRIIDVEPHSQYNLPEIRTIRSYFDRSFDLDHKVDIIYASHLIEHIENINEFFCKIYKLLKDDGDLVIACPNIQKSFQFMHLNAFTTDHLNYFTPDSLQNLAKKHGFYVKDYEQYIDHGMYFRFSKKPNEYWNFYNSNDILDSFRNYKQNIELFVDYINKMNFKQYYLFGAHAFTITFLRYLGSEDKVISILDNEPTKLNRRLTGTHLLCSHPEVVSEATNPVVLIYMGAYSNEICKQLVSINPNVKLIQLDKFQQKVLK